MRFPKAHQFLKWLFPAFAGAVFACLSLFVGLAQTYPKVYEWGEDQYSEWEKIVTTPLFVVMMFFLISGYVWALVYTGKPNEVKKNMDAIFPFISHSYQFTDGTPLIFRDTMNSAEKETWDKDRVDFDKELSMAQDALTSVKSENENLRQYAHQLESDKQLHIAIETMNASIDDIEVYHGPFLESLEHYGAEILRAERGEYSHGEGNYWLKSQCEMAAQYIPMLRDQFGISELEMPELENPLIETKSSDDVQVSPYQMMIEPSEILAFIAAHRRNLTAIRSQYKILDDEIARRKRELKVLNQKAFNFRGQQRR